MNGSRAPSPGAQGVQQPWPQAPNDDLSRDLAGAWEIANTAPKVSKVDQVLLVAGEHRTTRDDFNLIPHEENNIMQAQVKEGKAAAFATGVAAGLTAVGGMEVIEHGLNTFMEGIPVLMNALDEVAKLHPFIGGTSLCCNCIGVFNSVFKLP
jgi:hypothetical protein